MHDSMPEEVLVSIPPTTCLNHRPPKAAVGTQVAAALIQKPPPFFSSDTTVSMNEPRPPPAIGLTTCSPSPYSTVPLPIIAPALVQSLLPTSFATKPSSKFLRRHTRFSAQQKKAFITPRRVEELTRLQENQKQPPPPVVPRGPIYRSSCNQELI